MPECELSTYKFAHSQDEALQCLAGKQGRWDKKLNIIIDKHRSIITILSINEERRT